MSAITVDNDLVHYEVLGRGRPVILLHDWLGSWRYWVPAMQQLSMKYRAYALDLWGFGDSGRDASHYHFDAQVTLLGQFMEKLGINKAALVGHGLGAAVVVRYATQNPDRVPRLMAISPPLFRMAPASQSLTTNLPSAKSLPPAAAARPPALPSGSVEVKPAPGTPTSADPKTAAQPASVTTDKPGGDSRPGAAMLSEAETIPKLPDDMKARLQAALDKRAQALGEQLLSESTPKPPHLAAQPPTDRPATEVVTKSPSPPLLESLPSVPAMPKLDYVTTGEAQRANPLKDHLGTLDWGDLLKKHVDPGPDLDKLKVEVDKADMIALKMSVESFGDVDTLREMQRLAMACVAVYGAGDTFLPPPNKEMLALLAEASRPFHAVAMAGVKHFPMLENIAGFSRLLLDFLEATDITKLGIKETWERRVR
jgi:pimeloyl-ACP methyl ester carboxylesterase